MMLTAILTARTMLIKRFLICKVLLESKIFSCLLQTNHCFYSNVFERSLQ